MVFTFVAGVSFAGEANAGPTEDDYRKADEHNIKGNIYDDEGKFQEAIEEYREALKYDPEDTGTLFNMGIVCLKINLPGEAVQAFERVVSIDSKDIEAYNLLGLAYRSSGDTDKAIDTWKKSLTIDPEQEKVKQMIEESKNL